MEKTTYISNAISSAIYLLDNEIQNIDDEELIEEYQEVINKLESALKLTKEISNA